MANNKPPPDDWVDVAVDDWADVPVDDWVDVPVEQLPKTDPASAAVSSWAQGASGGYLDELAGYLEGMGSVVGIKGLGGPTGNITFGRDPRSFGQAVDEGAQNKLNQLRGIRQQYPTLSPTAEVAGGFTSGYALPIRGGSLSKILTSIGLGGVAGAGYAEGGLEERLQGAGGGAVIGGALPTAGAALRGTGKLIKSGASAVSGIPKQWMGRYFERGREMNRADTLPVIATEISDDLANIGSQATTKSSEAIDILNNEGVSIPRVEFILKIKDLLAKADPQNTSSKPVIAKLESYLKELEGTPGTHEIVNIPGVKSQTVPTSTRTIVGPVNQPPVPTRGQGYGVPIQEVRGVQGGTYEADPIEILVSGSKRVQVPTSRGVVVTRPGSRSSTTTPGTIEDIQIPGTTQIQVPTSTRSVITRPGEKGVKPTGEYTKRGVQNFDEFAKWMDKEGQGSTRGANLAREARGSLDQFLKEKPFGSENYKNKMKEVDDLMKLFTESQEGFSAPQTALNNIRGIGEGRETKHFASEALDRIGKQSGKNYRSRIDDQMTLEAFNPKESLKPTSGSRAVPRTMYDAGKDIVEAASRPIVKKTIETGAFFNRIIQRVPAPARKMLLEAKRAGGNAVSLTHGMLMRTDPEYAAIVEQEQQ